MGKEGAPAAACIWKTGAAPVCARAWAGVGPDEGGDGDNGSGHRLRDAAQCGGCCGGCDDEIAGSGSYWRSHSMGLTNFESDI